MSSACASRGKGKGLDVNWLRWGRYPKNPQGPSKWKGKWMNLYFTGVFFGVLKNSHFWEVRSVGVRKIWVGSHFTSLGTITYPHLAGMVESMIFLFPSSHALVPWRVCHFVGSKVSIWKKCFVFVMCHKTYRYSQSFLSQAMKFSKIPVPWSNQKSLGFWFVMFYGFDPMGFITINSPVGWICFFSNHPRRKSKRVPNLLIAHVVFVLKLQYPWTLEKPCRIPCQVEKLMWAVASWHYLSCIERMKYVIWYMIYDIYDIYIYTIRI